MSWKNLSLRRVLLTALIILGSWGLCSSLYQVKQSWDEYERSVELFEWADVAEQMAIMVRHLAYERGRTTVVLKEPRPISEADRHFIDERRRLAKAAFEVLDRQVTSLPKMNYPHLLKKWNEIEVLRHQVDRDRVLPIARRDPSLPSRWQNAMTGFLQETIVLAKNLAKHYHQTEEAHRWNLIGHFAYLLRLSAGEASSMISQRIAEEKVMPSHEMIRIHELRGGQAILWSEIERNVAYIGTEEVTRMLDRLKIERDSLHALQDQALIAWKRPRQAKFSADELTAKSAPLLDGISDFMLYAARETHKTAQLRMKAAREVLQIHIALDILMLGVMILAIFYVLRYVVTPLEVVDEKLRRIHLPMDEGGNFESNQIERLTQTAQTLERVFERKRRLEGELRELAFYDPLTHLPNRRLIEDRLLQHIARAKRQKNLLALLFIDLDRFKPINDEFGHETGDWVLRMVADRILGCIRESDAAARIGGDEFVVLLPDLHQMDDARAVAEKIREQLSQPFYMPNGQQFNISSSVGVAIYPVHAESVEELMRISDEAMYEAKHAGRDKVVMASAFEA